MDKPELRLTRWCHGPLGTFGTLTAPNLTLFTCEKPWKDNQRFISCIPPGKYNVVRYQSVDRGRCWLLVNVPDRDYILFHAGNTPTDTDGCILPGKKLTAISNLWAVGASRDAMAELNEYLEDVTSFKLTIDVLHPYSNT